MAAEENPGPVEGVVQQVELHLAVPQLPQSQRVLGLSFVDLAVPLHAQVSSSLQSTTGAGMERQGQSASSTGESRGETA